MMKAIRIHAHGGLDQLKFEEIDNPKPKPGEALIQIKACALNHLDLWVRKGIPGVKIPLPLIPGCDISGVLAQVGQDITHLQEGDEVVISPGVSCGYCPKCLSGLDHHCRHYGIIGENQNGGYTEYISLRPQNILPKPKNLSFEETAAIPLVFLTAWHMLVTLGNIAPGDWILIHAAGSGVGSAAIQIAKLHRAIILATAGSEEKLEKAKNCGADHLINYNKEDFHKRVREITGKRGVDLVVEHTGEKTFEGSYKSLCKGGRLITCGATSGYQAKLDLRYVFFKHLQILGSTMGSKGELAQIMELVSLGYLKPVIDQSFPLKEARQAQAYMEERKQFGKILVIP